MPVTPPQTAQLAGLLERSRAQDELITQELQRLQRRWALLHKTWQVQSLQWLESSGEQLAPGLQDITPLIAQMSGVLQRVGAGEAALLGLNMLELSPAGVDAIQQLRASIIKHVSTTQNFLHRAMWTRSEDVAELAKKSLETTKHRVAQALQEVPMLYARETHAQLSRELGLERFIYLGPADTRNRPFCRAIVGKVFTREEIHALDNGRGDDVMTRCGGWGCRHHWRGWSGLFRAGSIGGDPREIYLTVEATEDMVLQQTEYSCGAACGLQILKERGVLNVTQQQIMTAAFYSDGNDKTGRLGISYQNLARALNDLMPGANYVGGTLVLKSDLNVAAFDPGFYIWYLRVMSPGVIFGQGTHMVILDSIDLEPSSNEYIMSIRDPWGVEGPFKSNTGSKATISLALFGTGWRNSGFSVVGEPL